MTSGPDDRRRRFGCSSTAARYIAVADQRISRIASSLDNPATSRSHTRASRSAEVHGGVEILGPPPLAAATGSRRDHGT
ncbi:MAG: hypothetical protein WKF58_19610 [Ilumatobacteraceae bacterium]